MQTLEDGLLLPKKINVFIKTRTKFRVYVEVNYRKPYVSLAELYFMFSQIPKDKLLNQIANFERDNPSAIKMAEISDFQENYFVILFPTDLIYQLMKEFEKVLPLDLTPAKIAETLMY